MTVMELLPSQDPELQERARQMGVPPEVLLIVETLQADAGQKEQSAPLSLARLSKRTQLRMSTLRRFLSALEEAGVVRVDMNEDGTGSATLLVAPQ